MKVAVHIKQYWRKTIGIAAVVACLFAVQADTPNVKLTRFYPNPASGYINFEFSKEVDNTCVLQVYSFMGKKVYESVVKSPERLTIQLDDYTRGLYLFKLMNKQGQLLETGKFQVIK
jgi:hypothetical protein